MTSAARHNSTIGQWVSVMGYVAATVYLLRADPQRSGLGWLARRLRSRRRRGRPTKPTSSVSSRRSSHNGGSKPPRTTAVVMDDDEVYPAPMPKGDLTAEELRRYDGSDVDLPILLAARGVVYDVTRGRDFYGRGGAYAKFAGAECSRALAKMSLDPNDVSADISDLTPEELNVLDDWMRKFDGKYPVVGKLL